MEHMTDEELQQHECSDRIWLSRKEFAKWVEDTEPGIISILELKNRFDQVGYGTPFGVHHEDDDDRVYIPSWMYELLDYDDTAITISKISPGLCTQMTIQPFTSDHLMAEDPCELLRVAFEQYSCLTAGTTLPLWIGHAIMVDINTLLPDIGGPRCIRDCEVELELLKPLDVPEEPPAPPLPLTPSPVEPDSISHAEGLVTGGSIQVGKSHRELAYEAVLRRLKAQTDSNV